MDLLTIATLETGERFVFHLAFCLAYQKAVLETLARYGGSLVCQYLGWRVVSVLVLLDRRRAPAELPAVAEFRSHGTGIEHPFTAVRLWELDPEPVLAHRDQRFLPWAMLMNTTDEQVHEIAARVRAMRDEETVARFIILGSLRYDREVVERMLGGAYMGLVEAIMEGSSLVQDAKRRAAEEGMQQGMQQGRQEGQETEARQILRQALTIKFPGLDSSPALDQITDTRSLEKIILAALTESRAEVERMINQAASRS